MDESERYELRLADKLHSEFARAEQSLDSLIRRLTTWLVLGNGAGVAFTLAAFQQSLLALTSIIVLYVVFISGVAIAFVAVAVHALLTFGRVQFTSESSIESEIMAALHLAANRVQSHDAEEAEEYRRLASAARSRMNELTTQRDKCRWRRWVPVAISGLSTITLFVGMCLPVYFIYAQSIP